MRWCEYLRKNGVGLYYQGLDKSILAIWSVITLRCTILLNANLHFPRRRLIELTIEHGDLDALIDLACNELPSDELMIRRLKKRRLAMRDEIIRLQNSLQPDDLA